MYVMYVMYVVYVMHPAENRKTDKRHKAAPEPLGPTPA